MPHLFDPLTLRGVTLRNRIGMSPMCQYSAPGGFPTSWHMQHLGARAAGGCGLVMTEATAVEPRGRISLLDAGIWDDAHVAAWRPVAELIESLGAVPAMQLAHAGRKAGTTPPWDGGRVYPRSNDIQERAESHLRPAAGQVPTPTNRGADGAAPVLWNEPSIAPSPIPFSDAFPVPHELIIAELEQLTGKWIDAARRAFDAGFRALELHMAHGYLLHSFYSPLSNQRTDQYGGNRDTRMRYPIELAATVREVWHGDYPLFVRISATDWVEGGWSVDDSVELARQLKEVGVDLIDCSSGGTVAASAMTPVVKAGLAEPGYQVRFAEQIKREAGIATAAVGLITEPSQADEIVSSRQADLVLLGRELLRQPYWPLHAASALGTSVDWPRQYQRAKPD